ncbi:MAG: sirohydrochlorin chelatase [Planctomycetota bacterium]
MISTEILPPASKRLPIVAMPAPDAGWGERWRGAFGGSAGQSRGLLVVGHGTADPIGAAETHEITRRVAALLPGVPVELGFLEVIGPAIGAALQRLAERGCREVVAAPLLLFTAGHARRDVPEALEAGARLAGLAVSQSGAFGCHPEIVALSRQRRCEALHGLDPVPAESTVLVMVGRGSSDPAAPAHLAEFAAATLEPGIHAVRRDDACGRVELGFVAAARPSVAEALAAAALGATAGVRRVVVQPHLLFRGHVEEQVEASIRQAQAAHPQVEWVQVRRLGAADRVARALVERAAAAIR